MSGRPVVKVKMTLMSVPPPVQARYIRYPRKQDQKPPRDRKYLRVDRNPVVIGLVFDGTGSSGSLAFKELSGAWSSSRM